MNQADWDHEMQALARKHRALQRWGWVVLICCLNLWGALAFAQVPAEAHRYRAELTRAAHGAWGLDAPLATLAAQVHQESAWRPDARSAVGASGLAQFMPATATWWCEINGMAPSACQPTNPVWALRALVGYDRWLHTRVRAADGCERMAMTLSAYNGGLGWVQRDQRQASSLGLDPLRWWASVETVNAGRTAAAWRENRDYPQRILQRLEGVYATAGWGARSCA